MCKGPVKRMSTRRGTGQVTGNERSTNGHCRRRNRNVTNTTGITRNGQNVRRANVKCI